MSDDLRQFLKRQIEKAEQLSSVMERDRFEHIGAEKAFSLIMKQMPELANSFESRLEKDPDVNKSNAGPHVRRYVRNVIAHIQGMCEASALKQKNEVILCEGRSQSASMLADSMKKDLENLNKAEEAERARIAKRSEVLFEASREDIEIKEPPKSKGGRKVPRKEPKPKPLPVVSKEERQEEMSKARKSRKASHRNKGS